MVDRILLEWAHHGVVAAEGREPATDERRRANPERRAIGAGEQLVHVRVRVAAVDVAFAVAAGAQLPAIEREPLEIEHADATEDVPRRVRHHDRLRQVALGDRRTRRRGIGTRHDGNRLSGDGDGLRGGVAREREPRYSDEMPDAHGLKGSGGAGQSELRATVSLAIPVVFVQLGFMAMGAVDTLMVGRLSATMLAAVALGNLYFLSVSFFCSGTLMALDPLVAQAIGANDTAAVSRAMQRGLAIAVALSLFAAALFAPAAPISPRAASAGGHRA